MNTLIKQFTSLLQSTNKNLKKQVAFDIGMSIKEYQEYLPFILKNCFKMLMSVNADDRQAGCVILRGIKREFIIVDYSNYAKRNINEIVKSINNENEESIIIHQTSKTDDNESKSYDTNRKNYYYDLLDKSLFLGATGKEYATGNLSISEMKKQVSQHTGIDTRFVKVDLVNEKDYSKRELISMRRREKLKKKNKHVDETIEIEKNIENVNDFFILLNENLLHKEWHRRDGAFLGFIEILKEEKIINDENFENIDSDENDKKDLELHELNTKKDMNINENDENNLELHESNTKKNIDININNINNLELNEYNTKKDISINENDQNNIEPFDFLIKKKDMNINETIQMKESFCEKNDMVINKVKLNIKNTTKLNSNVIHYFLPKNFVLTCLQVLFSDKLVDFVCDQISMPVREKVKDVLSIIFEKTNDKKLLATILLFLENQDWQVQCSGIITLQKFIEYKNLIFDEEQEIYLCSILCKLLLSQDEDIKNFCAYLLCYINIENEKEILDNCFKSIEDSNEIAIGKKSILKLITKIYKNNKYSINTKNFKNLIYCLRSSISDVRFSAIEMLEKVFFELKDSDKEFIYRCVIEGILLEDNIEVKSKLLELFEYIYKEYDNIKIENYYLNIIAKDLDEEYKQDEFLWKGDELFFSKTGLRLLGKNEMLKGRVLFITMLYNRRKNYKDKKFVIENKSILGEIIGFVLNDQKFFNLENLGNNELDYLRYKAFSFEKNDILNLFENEENEEFLHLFSKIIIDNNIDIAKDIYSLICIEKSIIDSKNFNIDSKQEKFLKKEVNLDIDFNNIFSDKNEKKILSSVFFEEFDILENKMFFDFVKNDCNRIKFFYNVFNYIEKIEAFDFIFYESLGIQKIDQLNCLDRKIDINKTENISKNNDNNKINSEIITDKKLSSNNINNHNNKESNDNYKEKIGIIKIFIKNNIMYAEEAALFLYNNLNIKILKEIISDLDSSFYYLFPKKLLKLINTNINIREEANYCFSYIVPYLSIKKIRKDITIRKEIKKCYKEILALYEYKNEYKFECPMKIELRGYQKKGVAWISFLKEYGVNGILADDMGLGKTIMVLAFLSNEIYKINNKNKILIEKDKNEIIIEDDKKDFNTKNCIFSEENKFLFEDEKKSFNMKNCILSDENKFLLEDEKNDFNIKNNILCNENKFTIEDEKKDVNMKNCILSDKNNNIKKEEINKRKDKDVNLNLETKMLNQKRNTKVLILSPSSLTGHWEDEINKKFDYLNCKIHAKNDKIVKEITILSFDAFKKDFENISKIEYFYIIIDEGHVLKNRETILYKKVMQLKSMHKLVLTGTPIHNSVEDIFSLFNFLMPYYLGTEKEFIKNYSKCINTARESKASEKEVERAENKIIELHKKILPFVMRRLKSEVLHDLPPKIVTDILIDLDSIERKEYEKISDEEINNYVDVKSKKGSFKTMSELMKICSHKNYFLKKNIFEEENLKKIKLEEKNLASKSKNNNFINKENEESNLSAKVKALIDILNLCGGEDMKNKILVFCQFKSTIDYILKDIKYLNLKCERIDGSVKSDLRHKTAMKFNEDDSHILFLTTQIGGLGLNLTGADIVVMYEHDWNPFNDLQAMDRAHRIGQKRTVNVYRLITKKTIEERIMNLQNFKVYVANSVVSQQNCDVESMEIGEVLERFKKEGGEIYGDKDCE